MAAQSETQFREEFAREVFRTLDEGHLPSFAKSLFASGGEVRKAGHPQFDDLELGESRSADIASVFLDLSNFTGRTFWDDEREVARLAHSVLSGFAYVVRELGGHVLGLRGDGLYAGFGPSREPGLVAAVAGLAASVAVDAVKVSVNPVLAARGIAPVQARAGIDFGRVTFTRSGIIDSSEVNVVGFSANFAAKAEKIAHAWEIVVGEGFMTVIPGSDLITPHPDSPKKFTREGESRYYRYGFLHGSPTLSEYSGVVKELGGLSLWELGR